MANRFDQFDTAAAPRNRFDQFDTQPTKIDYSGAAPDVRKQVEALPEGEQRNTAYRDWADTYVAKQKAESRKSAMPILPLTPIGIAANVLGINSTVDADDAMRGVARGTLVGSFADEFAATMDSLPRKLGFEGPTYDEAVAYQRARDRSFDTEKPVASVGLQVAGGLAGGTGAARAVMAAPTIASRALQGARVGATYGGVSGFGNSEGGVLERLPGAATGAAVGGALGGIVAGGITAGQHVARARAQLGETGAYTKVGEMLGQPIDDFADQVATGAARNRQDIQRRTLDVLGEEMVRAGGDRAAARTATVARISREAGVTPATATEQVRRLTAVHADNPLMLSEYPAVGRLDAASRMQRPQNVDLQDLGNASNPQSQQVLDYLGNTAGRAVQETRDAVATRQSQLPDYARETLRRLSPHTLDDAEQLVERARTAAQQEYQAAFTGPQNVPRLVGGLQVAIRRAEQRLGQTGGEHTTALRGAMEYFNPVIARGANSAPVRGMVTQLEAAQNARTAVRGMMQSARQSGRDDIAGLLQPLYDDVTLAMSSASPRWRVANDRWAHMTRSEDALEIGQQFTERASLQQRQLLRDFDRMAPEAQDMVRVGYVQKQLDKLDGIRDTHDVSKLFDTDQLRNVVERLFGRQAVIDLVRATRNMEVANRSTRNMGGSQTHMRGQMQQAMDAETGLVAAAENASARGVQHWLVNKLMGLLTDARNRPLSRIATTPMRDTAAVAEHIERMRRARTAVNAPYRAPGVPAARAIGTMVGPAAAYREDHR